MNERSDTVFCNDSQLSYDKYQTKFVVGQGLLFDEAYRLAHLPLVAPEHPLVITNKPGSNYHRGKHDLIFSIVLPIVTHELFASEVFNRLNNEVKATKFSRKLSWSTFAQRKSRLHATICSAIATVHAPIIQQQVYQQLRSIGPVSIRVRGLFSGNINIGRLYLKIYPELRHDKNICHEIQAIFDLPATDLYLVGLYNFIEELNASEAQELREFLESWRDVDIMLSSVETLWLLKSRDDLVLDGAVEQFLPLV